MRMLVGICNISGKKGGGNIYLHTHRRRRVENEMTVGQGNILLKIYLKVNLHGQSIGYDHWNSNL
jgi:hypothetical protein